jgi:FkbM family methyltransferase
MWGQLVPGEPRIWTVDVGVEAFPFLDDHRLRGVAVLPGSAVVDMLLSAATSGGTPSPAVEELRLEQICILPRTDSRRLRVNLTELATVSSGPNSLRTTHAVARVTESPFLPGETAGLAQAIRQSSTEVSSERHYRLLEAAGNNYGPAFRVIRRIWRSDCEAAAALGTRSRESARVVLLDAAIQLVAAAAGDPDRPFVWAGCERVQVSDAIATADQAYARLRSPADADEVTGDASLLDSSGKVVAELTGVRLHRIRDRRNRVIAMAATFDAGPLVAELRAIAAPLGARVIYETGDSAPALIGDGGPFASHLNDVNVLLLRPEDLRDPPGRFTVPGIGEIAHLHEYETEYLYDEIFKQETYLRHGVTLHPGDTVFDIGANIGMFTLFVQHRFPGARVYAFEPAPPTFEALRENVARYCPDSQAFNYGISGENGSKPFTYYRNSTVFSGFAADPERDAATIRTVVENVLHAQFPATTLDLRPIVSGLLRDRLAADVQQRLTKTLSSVLRDTGVDRIDLLKIDTEGSEAEVLLGIEDTDWGRIRQVVLEVHGRDEQRQDIVTLLERRGFKVVVDRQEDLLRGTALTAVVARRPDDRPELASGLASEAADVRPSARRAIHLSHTLAALQAATDVRCIVYGPGDEDLLSALADVPRITVVTNQAALLATIARLLDVSPAPLSG